MPDPSRVDEFEKLAMPLFTALYNHARWLTRDPAEAEDIVQETYLKAYRGFASFTPGTNLRAWMYRILRNTFLTARSGLRTLESIEDDSADVEQLPACETPESVFFHRANVETLRRAIEALPLPFREVLLLCDVENLSYKEIAEMLSIPIGTVTSRLVRARNKVRQAIEDDIVRESR
jgi:RNA polymerase sigma-70 factor (ECF subfamily)